MILRISLCLLAASVASCSWDHTVDSIAPALECRSNPPGASIILDEHDTGQVTPYGFEYLVPGEHRVEIRLEHYQSRSYRFQHYAGASTLVSCVLESALGDLAVSSSPIGAAFRLVGFDATYVTPDTIRGLDQSSYDLVFTMEDYSPDTVHAWVSAQQLRHAHGYLQALPGWLAVATAPPGASLRFSSQDAGCTSPCTFGVAQTGVARHLVATLQGYQPLDTLLMVPPNDTLAVTLVLSP